MSYAIYTRGGITTVGVDLNLVIIRPSRVEEVQANIVVKKLAANLHKKSQSVRVSNIGIHILDSPEVVRNFTIHSSANPSLSGPTWQ